MKIIFVLGIFILFPTYAEDLSAKRHDHSFWEKVYENEWDKITDFIRWYYVYEGRPKIKIDGNENFLMNDEEITSFCKKHVKAKICPIMKGFQYVVNKLYEFPNYNSEINGNRVVRIRLEKVDKLFSESAPAYTFVKGELLIPSLEVQQNMFKNDIIFLPVLEYKEPKDKGDEEWIRLPSMGKKINLWLSSKYTGGFSKEILGKERFDLGMVRMSDLRSLTTECFLKIENGKAYYKVFLFKPGEDENFNTKNFEELEFFKGWPGRKVMMKSYLKDVSAYPDYIFQMDAKKYFFEHEINLLADVNVNWEERMHYPKGRQCETQLFVKDIPRNKRREIYLQHGGILIDSEFVPARLNEFFLKLDQTQPNGSEGEVGQYFRLIEPNMSLKK